MISNLADGFAGHGAATASAGARRHACGRVQREANVSLTLTFFGCASGWRWRPVLCALITARRRAVHAGAVWLCESIDAPVRYPSHDEFFPIAAGKLPSMIG